MAYNEDDVAAMAIKGRAPSYNARGQVRGFRTRPGAPQANPNRNIGALGSQPSGLTTQGNWDRMFRNRITGETPSSLADKRNAPPEAPGYEPAQAPASVPSESDQPDNFEFGLTGLPKLSAPRLPSLEDLSTGINHAKLWSSPAIGQTTQAPTWSQTMGGNSLGNWLNRTVRSKYGWGSSVI